MEGKSKKLAQWGKGRTAIGVLRREIFPELDRGEPMTRVYQKYKERLGVSYMTFTRWVHFYRETEKETPGSKASQRQSSPVPAANPGHEPRQFTPPPPKTFVFDPELANTIARELRGDDNV